MAVEPIDAAWPPVLTAVGAFVAVAAIVVVLVFLRRARAALRDERARRD